MIRPPPLQLKYDNRFPIPARTPSKQKSASFASQLYKANWKNAVIAVAGLNGLRYAFATYNAIVDAAIDDEEVFDNLFKVSLALAVIYLFTFFIEVYGIISLVSQRLRLIRGYLYLTLLGSILVTAAGVLKGVSYFAFAEEIVYECVALAMEGRGYEKSLFRSRPWPNTVFRLRKTEARKHCTYAWVHQSWSQVASVFIFALIPAVIYYLLVYTYYCQTTDASHPANLQHNLSSPAPPPPRRAVARPQPRAAPGPAYSNVGYSRIANGFNSDADNSLSQSTNNPMVERGLTTSRLQAAPAYSRGAAARGNGAPAAVAVAPPPNKGSNPFATKGIKRSRRPPPLIPSPSPLGFTPGAPAYGPSRVYAAFAAPVDSPEYDKFV